MQPRSARIVIARRLIARDTRMPEFSRQHHSGGRRVCSANNQQSVNRRLARCLPAFWTVSNVVSSRGHARGWGRGRGEGNVSYQFGAASRDTRATIIAARINWLGGGRAIRLSPACGRKFQRRLFGRDYVKLNKFSGALIKMTSLQRVNKSIVTRQTGDARRHRARCSLKSFQFR